MYINNLTREITRINAHFYLKLLCGVRVDQGLVVFCISLFFLFHLAIVLHVLRHTASDYPFGILAIVLHVLRHTASDYPFGILAIVLHVLRHTASDYPFGILAIVLHVLRHTASDYPFVSSIFSCFIN